MGRGTACASGKCCLCHKFRAKQFSDISTGEAGILQQALTEAPHLFHIPLPRDLDDAIVRQGKKRLAAPTASRVRKQPRKHKQAPSPSPSSSPSSSPAANGPLPDPSREQLLVKARNNSPPRLSPAAADLVKTYSPHSATSVFGNGHELDIGQVGGCSTGGAVLYHKGQSVDPIVREIENALPFVNGTRHKVYHILRIGSRWAAILHHFGPVVNRAPAQLTGLSLPAAIRIQAHATFGTFS
ncbi:hypothetical protein HRG_015021 [Hirsutella rhossiliensis]